MDWLECGVLFTVALIATIALTPLAKRLATRLDAIDYPSSRRVNNRPIPRLGGVAILGGLIVCVLVVFAGMRWAGWRSPFVSYPGMPVNYPVMLVGVLFMFAVGFVDDVMSLRPRIKLAGQVIAATIVACSGLLLSSIHNPFGAGYIEFGPLAYPLTIFYLVAFANIINLIDGLDGLAAGICAISASTIFVFAIITHRYDAAVFSIALAGACVGFLRYNFHPASIFMGDSGALTLGFALGIVSLMAIARSALFVSLLVPVLAAGIPVLDTAFAIIRRVRAHKPIDAADKGHIHHRLLQAGFSQRKTVLIMWGWTLILALSGIFITETTGLMRIPFLVIILGVTLYMVLKLRLLDPVLLHHYHPRGRKDYLPDQMASRHAEEASHDDGRKPGCDGR